MAKNLLNELPVDFPEKELKSLFNSYPQLNLSGPSSWVLWSGAKSQSYIQHACHARLKYEDKAWDNLITAVPKTDELSLEYLRMLVRGPFRSMSDLIKLDRIKDNYYLHCMSLDKWPANVLMNFCIASRVPIEFAFLLKPWAKRCDAGFDATLAFLLAYSYGNKDKTKIRGFDIQRSGHMWIDAASNWENILCGEMVGLSESFKSHPHQCTPTNNIWGRSNDYMKLVKLSDEEIAEFYSVPIRVVECAPPKSKLKKKLGFYNYAIQDLQAMQAIHVQQPGALPINPLDAHAQHQAAFGEAQPVIPGPVWVFEADVPEAQPQHDFDDEDDDIFPDHDDFDEDEDF